MHCAVGAQETSSRCDGSWLEVMHQLKSRFARGIYFNSFCNNNTKTTYS